MDSNTVTTKFARGLIEQRLKVRKIPHHTPKIFLRPSREKTRPPAFFNESLVSCNILTCPGLGRRLDGKYLRAALHNTRRNRYRPCTFGVIS
jgi:hypothetical protein